MLKKLVRVLGLLAVLMLAAAACSPAAGPAGASAIEITDHLGRVVTLEKAPQRIVSLAPSNTEILFALGLGDKVVGVTTYDDYPAEASAKPKIGGFSTPDIEKIVAQAPDLVVAASIHAKAVLPQLQSRGLKVIVLAPKTVDDVMQAISMAGEATGTGPAARQVVSDMRARIAAVNKLVSSAQATPGVFYVVWHDPLKTAGPDTLQGQLISLAGGRNLFDDLERYPAVDLEVLLERQPQVIIVGTGHGSGQKAPLEWATSEPRLKGTEALRQGKVLEIDANLVSRAGPRIVDGLEEMLRLIHPELAAELKR